MFLTPDLTGQNELYKVSNHRKTIITNEQVVPFGRTVHVDSISVTLLGTINQQLVRDVDWVVTELNHDVMGSMRTREPSFTKDLCDSITIIKPYDGADYEINLVYQSLYPIRSKVFSLTNEVVEFTPDVLAEMYKIINYLMDLVRPIPDVNTPNANGPWGLEQDPHLERPENFIKAEQHHINVPGGKFFVHPKGGSFHKSALKIKDLNTGNSMKEGVDYKVYGYHPHKTGLTSDPGGVHEFILFLKPYVGIVEIDYHAFGGDVTINDHRIIVETMNNIMQFINQSQFVTFENLKGAPILTELYSYIKKLETEVKSMRSLLSGRPSAADASHGQVMKKRIMANDTALHWWNIASLYKVDGSDDVVTADVLKIRVRTMHTVFMFDAIIAFNLNAPDKKMEVSVLSPVYPKGYIPYEDYDGLNNIIRPQFRCIWNDNTVEGSGIMLQLGMPLKTVAEDVLVVENWSGMESCWKLVPSPVDGQYGDDAVVELPASNHIWDMDNPDSNLESMLVPFEDGHIVWAGSIPLNSTTGAEYLTLNHLLEDEVDIRRIRRMSLDLSEDTTNKYRVVVEFVPGSDKLIGSTQFWYNGRSASVVGIILRNEHDKIVIKVDADITAGSASNPLYLRHVIIHTN